MANPAQPRFRPEVVDADPRDGYWVQAVDVDGDGRPDIVTSGLTRGEVVWYQNPGWRRRVVTTLPKPVAVDCADLTGDGRPDLVLCHDYGNCMFACGPHDGKISWLRNPTAADPDGAWEQRPIADLVATHRIRVGRFTADHLQLAALPVVGPEGGAAGVGAPVRVMVYDQPDDPLSTGGWTGKEVDAGPFRIIHGVLAGRFPGTPRPDRDSFVLASGEGVTWVGYGDDGRWRQQRLGTGVAAQRSHEFPEHEFSGTGNLALARVGGRDHALMLTVEPFHGDTVAVYLRPPGDAPFGAAWQRRQLEVFPRPDATHDAVAHHVVAADFDGDGDDEFLVALRGPEPVQGVLYYKFDADGRVLVRERVTTESVARIAVADVTGDGRLDFVTTSYDTVGYYEVAEPAVRLHVNDFGRPTGAAAPPGGDG